MTTITGAFNVVRRNAMVYRKSWKSTTVFSVLQPLMFFGALGVGLGQLIDIESTEAMGGLPYLAFIGPGLLAAACMQTATFEASFVTISKVTYRKNYEAMLATPLVVRDLVWGELQWMAVHLGLLATAFFIVLTAFSPPDSALSLLAIPAAILTGVSCAALMMGFAAKRKSFNDLSWSFRFIVTPMFLFSGAFFPVSRLPDALEKLAAATPLYHGVELTRGLTAGSLTAGKALGHLAYLLILLALGGVYTHRSLKKALEK